MLDRYARMDRGPSSENATAEAYCPRGQVRYRQSMTDRRVREGAPTTPQPLGGVADIGRRIAEAREGLGLNKAELARRIGKSWRLLHKWEEGDQNPDRESLALLARELGMTIEELMGIAAGQDPPFAAWGAFLIEVESEGDALSDDEARALRSIVWPTGREPTVRGYWNALGTIRTGTRRRA